MYDDTRDHSYRRGKKSDVNRRSWEIQVSEVADVMVKPRDLYRQGNRGAIYRDVTYDYRLSRNNAACRNSVLNRKPQEG